MPLNRVLFQPQFTAIDVPHFTTYGMEWRRTLEISRMDLPQLDMLKRLLLQGALGQLA